MGLMDRRREHDEERRPSDKDMGNGGVMNGRSAIRQSELSRLTCTDSSHYDDSIAVLTHIAVME